MRKVIFLMHISLDGFVADSNGGLDWITYTPDLEQYVYALHDQTDAAIYGRVTYQMMEGYWLPALTNPASSPVELEHSRWLDKATKVVVSKTLPALEWQPAVLIRENLKEEITKLKAQPGKAMWLLGSPSLARAFMELNLIDEYWLNVNPVLLGGGTPLYGKLPERLKLTLIEAKTLDGGVIALRYAPVK